jgi:hypothetical protein
LAVSPVWAETIDLLQSDGTISQLGGTGEAAKVDCVSGCSGSGGGGTEFAEDSAHSSGAEGTLMLGVRRDADTSPVSADNDYHALQFDNAGNLKVNIKAGAGSGGTAMTDDAAFTPATTSVTPIAGCADDTSPDSVNEGDAGCVRMNANRALHTILRDAAGNERGLNIDANGEVGVSAIRSALPAGTNNIGDVDVLTLPGTGVEDAAETAGGTLQMSGTVRRDTAASSAGASGDNATMNTDANGLAWTRTMDPCSALAKTYLPVNISTATTTELTSSLAGASTHYYVCSLNLVTAAANNVALVDDDTDNCASVTSGLAGGTTAGSGWNFAANGGLTIGNGQASVFRTNGTNRVLCLVTSAATQLSGSITVVAAP